MKRKCAPESDAMETECAPEPDLATWTIEGDMLIPTFAYLQSLSNFSEALMTPDQILTFRFASTAPPALIHESKLQYAGGPLAVLASGDFRESAERVVQLSDEDDPETFAVIRKFLYGSSFTLRLGSQDAIFRVARAAHRWELRQLLVYVCNFIVLHDLISTMDVILQAKSLISMGGVTEQFRKYFWTCAALLIPSFIMAPLVANPHDAGVTILDVRKCHGFLEICDLALSQSELRNLFGGMVPLANDEMRKQLLDLIAYDLEPRIPDDYELFQLIELIGPDSLRRSYLLEGPKDGSADCSQRALRLLSKSLLDPSEPQLGMSCSWEIFLFKIAPCRINFLYGSAGLHMTEIGSGSTKSFDAHSAIHLAVTTTAAPDAQVEVKIECSKGSMFPKKLRTMELEMTILAGGECHCSGWKKEERLYQRTMTINLRARTRVPTLIEETIGEEAFEKLRRVHGLSNECAVRALLKVQVHK